MNILGNGMGTEQANELIKIMESHSNLKTLCGFSGDETELNLARCGLTAGCGVLVANEIKNNGALVKFTFSGDNYDSKPVTIESSMTEADFSGKVLQASGAIMLAAFLPKCRYVQEYPSVRPLIYFLPSGR